MTRETGVRKPQVNQVSQASLEKRNQGFLLLSLSLSLSDETQSPGQDTCSTRQLMARTFA